MELNPNCILGQLQFFWLSIGHLPVHFRDPHTVSYYDKGSSPCHYLLDSTSYASYESSLHNSVNFLVFIPD